MTISIRVNTAAKQSSKVISISATSPSSVSPQENGVKMQAATVVTGENNRFGERNRDSVNIVVNSKGSAHLQVNQGGYNLHESGNNNNSIKSQVNINSNNVNANLHFVNNNSDNPLLGNYTQEGGGEDNLNNNHVIASENENHDSDDDDVVAGIMTAGSGDAIKNKDEMFKQDLNDDVIVEDALMDDIVGHMATSGNSDV